MYKPQDWGQPAAYRRPGGNASDPGSVHTTVAASFTSSVNSSVRFDGKNGAEMTGV